jgi:hypothetical protein
MEKVVQHKGINGYVGNCCSKRTRDYTLSIKFESYKTALNVVTQAFRKIEGLFVQIGKTNYSMVFMVVNTNNYDVLLGLSFLIKIRTMMKQPNHSKKSTRQ